MSKRGTSKERGYDQRHRKLRTRFGQQLKRAGQLPCARCGLPVFAVWPLDPPSIHLPKCARKWCQGQCWTDWDLGHTDDRTGYNGVEHTVCNRSAGAVNSNAAQGRRVRRSAGTVRQLPLPRDGGVTDYGW